MADAIAKHAMKDDFRFHVFEFAPNFTVDIIRVDIAQICFPRGF